MPYNSIFALRIINFSERRDHAIPLFIDANLLPLNFLYYDQTIFFAINELAE